MSFSGADYPTFLNDHSFGCFHRGPASSPEAGHYVQLLNNCWRLPVAFKAKCHVRSCILQPTLEGDKLAKISAMTLDLLPDNHPEIDPGNLFLQITALRETEPAGA